MAKVYKIHPAIGVARVGNSKEFFVGPELPGVPARTADGKFKTNGAVRRQAARFRVYEYDDADPGAAPVEITAGTGGNVARIEWTVHLANHKAAWYRFQGTTGEDGNYPPNSLRNPSVQPADPADIESGDRRKLIIDPGPRTIASGGQPVEIAKGQSGNPSAETWPPPLSLGKKIDSLGTLTVDANGRLVAAGGYGTSGTTDNPPGNLHFANNDNWFDDVSDGPVTASIVRADGSRQAVGSPAWLIVGIPDFAPTVSNVVTLHDLLYDLSVRRFELNPNVFAAGQFKPGPQGYKPSYTKEIYPILRRALDQRWVFNLTGRHTTMTNHQLLGTLAAGDPASGARRHIFRRINNPDQPVLFTSPPGGPRMPWLLGDNDSPTILTLTRTQYFLLTQWKDGHFLGDWSGVPAAPTQVTPQGLDIAALENCAGGGFYPGMEVGWIMRNVSIYRKDAGPAGLRLRHKAADAQGIGPGELTKRMALPWQADFNACEGNWWPGQRPERVRTAANPQVPVRWAARSGTQDGFLRNLEMVDAWHELGFVKGDPTGTTPLLEDERNWPRS